LSDRGTVVVGGALVVVVVVVHSVAPLQVPLVPQVQVPAVHAAMTVFLHLDNAPPLNPDSAALPAQSLLLHAGDGFAVGACPNEGATLSQKRAATTVIGVTVPMSSSVPHEEPRWCRSIAE